ncbi:hypothetical protein LCGC14_1731960 [marine sediment metagenome]|uniref:Uncharacterized protein n=1 Tax=marine sediment metagenome TaxID=412755 RepID=A0A0F9HX04_9ZZZZ
MEKSKKLCQGCRDDYYNHHRDEGCWSFANAEVVQLQRVGICDSPPYEWNPEVHLSCYCADGCAMLTKDDSRINVAGSSREGV